MVKTIGKILKTEPKLTNTVAPIFNHIEIQNLYNFGLEIPPEKLKEIIALPHVSLVEDLEKTLLDAINRYDYFVEIGWEENTHSFVLHALFLLKEINAEKSLPHILSFFQNNEEFLDYWLGDHTTETLWQCFYSLGFNNTELLKEFLLQPGIYTYCKTEVPVALCQMVLHHPEKREEILAVYNNMFGFFSKASSEENVIDSEFLGLAIGEAIDCNLHELLPLIKVLFDKGYVSLGINGDYSNVEKEFSKVSTRDHKRKLFNIFEIYDDVVNTWAGYNDDPHNSYTPEPKQAGSVKIGRNDPCPCGSGNKYKKCCLKN